MIFLRARVNAVQLDLIGGGHHTITAHGCRPVRMTRKRKRLGGFSFKHRGVEVLIQGTVIDGDVPARIPRYEPHEKPRIDNLIMDNRPQLFAHLGWKICQIALILRFLCIKRHNSLLLNIP